MEHSRIFLCNGEMYSTYAAASVARDVCSCCATWDAGLLCALLRMRLKPLNFFTSVGMHVLVLFELERDFVSETSASTFAIDACTLARRSFGCERSLL